MSDGASSAEMRTLRDEAARAVADASDVAALEQIRIGLLGKAGRLTSMLRALGKAGPDERRERAPALNLLRDSLAEAIASRRSELDDAALDARIASEAIDVTLPPPTHPSGMLHPVMRTMEEMAAIFGAMGFEVGEGSDIQDDWFNFGALNIPGHHPARAEHDTFYLPGDRHGRARLLRTQTSDVQVISMLGRKSPFRVIAPGRTYRSDHDATHSPMFHQCEGIAIEQGLTLGHLKGCLTDFLRAFFGLADLPVRFRASYFPFTEPSMEADIRWDRETGAVGKGNDWLEILGSGMVHPKVLANCGLDPATWQGFAFGMGVERVAMLKHGIPDLRPFYESDQRWLYHYGFDPMMPASLHEGLIR